MCENWECFKSQYCRAPAICTHRIWLPEPTPDQREYLERIAASMSYDPSIVIGGPRKKT